ncbi:MAG: Mrp/NBP35 family ATP-binding protein [Pseudomonadota bacterium]
MSDTIINEYQQKLGALIDPYAGTTWSALGVQSEVSQSVQGVVSISLTFPYPIEGQRAAILARVALVAPGAAVSLKSHVFAIKPQESVHRLPAIKNIIVVSAGKGGVGKSTLATNLAVCLQAEGATVGLLDADIYGPSQPLMLNSGGRAQVSGGRFQPIMRYGLATMSIGYLLEPTTATVWRGPMATGAMMQLLQQTDWPACDYLIMDMPPGTGDIPLTMAQKIPVSGAVLISTPQQVACADVRKGYEMFEKLKIRTLGIVENMSGYTCPACGHDDPIFGTSSHVPAMAEALGLPLLGQIPLKRDIQACADQGMPLLLASSDAAVISCFQDLARRVAARLAMQPRDYALATPIVTSVNSKQEQKPHEH